MGLMIQVLSLLICACFLTADASNSDSGDCLRINETSIRDSFERICSQELLLQVKQSVDNITALLMSDRSPGPTPTCRHVDQKQQLVSALIGKLTSYSNIDRSINPLTCSGIKWLRLKVFNAIQV